MELTQEQLRHIEAIKSTMKCPTDFRCEKSGFSACPKVKPIAEFLECSEKDAEYCPFSSPFGLGYFCPCPLNRYVQNLSGTTPVQ